MLNNREMWVTLSPLQPTKLHSKHKTGTKGGGGDQRSIGRCRNFKNDFFTSIFYHYLTMRRWMGEVRNERTNGYSKNYFLRPKVLER